MRPRLRLLAAVLLCMASTAGLADLAPYGQSFEGLDQSNPAALANDGWLVFGNVFNSDWSYAYGYGPFPAPNPGGGFSAIASGQGGPRQGAQQLSIYSDYNNGGHGFGQYIESNVFREQVVGAGDVGTVWAFQFDAKRGNIGGGTTALAFIKTLDPNAGYALTNFVTVDMTGAPDTWEWYQLLLKIDSDLVGQIFQIGFANTATNYEGSGIFYDNINFERWRPLSVTMDTMSATVTEAGVLVQWATISEADTQGFRVLRETPDERHKSLVPASPLISPAGSSLTGAAYEFLDDSKGAAGTQAYWIEDVDALGKITRHGPIVVERPTRVGSGGTRRIATER